MKESDSSRVVCFGRGTKRGYLDIPMDVTIDTRDAGPGELEIFCKGSNTNGQCEVRDFLNGTFDLQVQVFESGQHQLNIKYDGEHVPGSPFNVHVSAASRVKVEGPGLHDDLITGARVGEFVVDTHAVGGGEVKVMVGGPRGAFHVQTEKRGKRLFCKYHPSQPGMYTVHVMWHGDHVPASPYELFLCETEEELRDHQVARLRDAT